MPKEKFNPIAELPLLPGVDIANDEVVTNIIDATYPPIDGPNKNTVNPQIEIRLKEEKLEETTTEKENGKRLVIVRTIILICLIVLVFIGIFLTLSFVPKMASNISNFSKSLFVSQKTAGPSTTSTSTQTSTIPLVATSTTQTIATISTTTPQQKTPAKLVATILSTNAIGNQVIVKFNIQNIGGTTSGKWSFVATLPSNATPKYYSVTQAPLTPQSGVIYTLGFNANQDLPVQIVVSQ
jgi:hypothetical protein